MCTLRSMGTLLTPKRFLLSYFIPLVLFRRSCGVYMRLVPSLVSPAKIFSDSHFGSRAEHVFLRSVVNRLQKLSAPRTPEETTPGIYNVCTES